MIMMQHVSQILGQKIPTHLTGSSEKLVLITYLGKFRCYGLKQIDDILPWYTLLKTIK